MTFLSNFILRVVPHSSLYQPLPTNGGQPRPQQLIRSKSNDSKRSIERYAQEPGTSPFDEPNEHAVLRNVLSAEDFDAQNEPCTVPNLDADETSSLISSTQEPDERVEGDIKADHEARDAHHVDIRGLKMIPRIEFWQLFILLGLLTGIGLMTIKYVMKHLCVDRY